jgi:hypothetical protein
VFLSRSRDGNGRAFKALQGQVRVSAGIIMEDRETWQAVEFINESFRVARPGAALPGAAGSGQARPGAAEHGKADVAVTRIVFGDQDAGAAVVGRGAATGIDVFGTDDVASGCALAGNGTHKLGAPDR